MPSVFLKPIPTDVPVFEAVRRRWRERRWPRLLATTVLATCVMLATSAEGEDLEPSQGGTEAAAEDCNYMPATKHPAFATTIAQAKEIGKDMVIHCFGEGQWSAAETLWEAESSWRPWIISGGKACADPASDACHKKACGITQPKPCSKLLDYLGVDSLQETTVEDQLRWGINYIIDRYNTPEEALEFWYRRVPINGKDVGNWY